MGEYKKTDAERLREIAQWFDDRDLWGGAKSTDVQDDLRRIADNLEARVWRDFQSRL